MKFTEEQLENFREIYRKEFGIFIDKDDAEKKGENLIRFVKAVNIGLVNLKEYNSDVDPDY